MPLTPIKSPAKRISFSFGHKRSIVLNRCSHIAKLNTPVTPSPPRNLSKEHCEVAVPNSANYFSVKRLRDNATSVISVVAQRGCDIRCSHIATRDRPAPPPRILPKNTFRSSQTKFGKFRSGLPLNNSALNSYLRKQLAFFKLSQCAAAVA